MKRIITLCLFITLISCKTTPPPVIPKEEPRDIPEKTTETQEKETPEEESVPEPEITVTETDTPPAAIEIFQELTENIHTASNNNDYEFLEKIFFTQPQKDGYIYITGEDEVSTRGLVLSNIIFHYTQHSFYTLKKKEFIYEEGVYTYRRTMRYEGYEEDSVIEDRFIYDDGVFTYENLTLPSKEQMVNLNNLNNRYILSCAALDLNQVKISINDIPLDITGNSVILLDIKKGVNTIKVESDVDNNRLALALVKSSRTEPYLDVEVNNLIGTCVDEFGFFMEQNSTLEDVTFTEMEFSVE